MERAPLLYNAMAPPISLAQFLKTYFEVTIRSPYASSMVFKPSADIRSARGIVVICGEPGDSFRF